MRTPTIVSLLALLGLASIGIGIQRMHGHKHQAFARHVAAICVQAGQRAMANKPEPK